MSAPFRLIEWDPKTHTSGDLLEGIGNMSNAALVFDYLKEFTDFDAMELEKIMVIDADGRYITATAFVSDVVVRRVLHAFATLGEPRNSDLSLLMPQLSQALVDLTLYYGTRVSDA